MMKNRSSQEAKVCIMPLIEFLISASSSLVNTIVDRKHSLLLLVVKTSITSS